MLVTFIINSNGQCTMGVWPVLVVILPILCGIHSVSCFNFSAPKADCSRPDQGFPSPLLAKDYCADLVLNYFKSLPDGDLVWTTDPKLATGKPGTLPVQKQEGPCQMIIDSTLRHDYKLFSRDSFLSGAARIFYDCFEKDQIGQAWLEPEEEVFLDLSTDGYSGKPVVHANESTE